MTSALDEREPRSIRHWLFPVLIAVVGVLYAFQRDWYPPLGVLIFFAAAWIAALNYLPEQLMEGYVGDLFGAGLVIAGSTFLWLLGDLLQAFYGFLWMLFFLGRAVGDYRTRHDA